MALKPDTRLGRYAIGEQIGAGGMGEVYRARDLRLQREVALKLLAPGLATDPASIRRFEQEAIAASALNHPHILQIYDIGDDLLDGTPVHFMAMELIQGCTLRRRLNDRAPMRDMLRVMVQVGSALARTHAVGIIHRDLKPENIMVTLDGYAKVLDFGLAKLTEPLVPSEQIRPDVTAVRTSAGTVMGTPAYMSPEQAAARPCDARSDIFSFGAILYEVVSGTAAFSGSSFMDILHSVLHDTPSPAPLGSFVGVIERCMAKDPDCRYPSIAEAVTDLEAALGGASSESPRRSPREKRPGRSRSIDSIVVLPFSAEASDADVEYLGDGIAETLMGGLAQLPNLRVVPRSTAFRYRGRDDFAAIARELQVGAILSGRVSRRGNSIVVGAELIDTAKDAQLWGDQYSRQLADLLDVQKSIAAEITAQLRPALSGSRKRLVTRVHTEDPEAYQSFLKGRFHLYRRSEESLRKAIHHFEEAIEHDPAYARGYAGIADAWLMLGWYAVIRPREAFPKALAAARRAMELDGGFAEARTAFAYALFLTEWQFPEAEREFLKAIEINPSEALAHHWYADLLQSSGRMEEAIAHARQACALDPLALILNAELGRAFYYARQYDRAIDQQQRTLELQPEFAPSLLFLGQALERTGRLDEAVAVLRRGVEVSQSNPAFIGFLGHALARSGNQSAAREQLDLLVKRSAQRWVPSFAKGFIQLGLGEMGAAAESLNGALEERSHWLLYAAVDPAFDDSWGDERLRPLREQIDRIVFRRA